MLHYFSLVFNTLCSHCFRIYHKVQISSKITDLNSPFRLLRLVKFESLWIQVYSLVFALGSQTVFSLSFPFFEFWRSSLKGLFSLIHYCWMIFTVGFPSFYSALLRFLVYQWFLFLPLAALGIKTNVMSAILVASHFLISWLFFPFEVPSPKVHTWPSSSRRS